MNGAKTTLLNPAMAAALVAILACTLISKATAGQDDDQEPKQESVLGTLPIELQELFPLTSQERRLIREEKQKEQEAIYNPLREVTPIRDFQRIGTSGDQMPTVHVTPDYPSSVVFTDLTGAPWPIQYISQTDSLAVIEQPTGTENVIVLHAEIAAGQKSISVFLEGSTLPITIIVDGSDRQYHALKHLRIGERGPRAKGLITTASARSTTSRFQQDSSSGESLDSVFNKLAYRVTPDGYTKLQTSDRGTDAWIENENSKVLYVMTEHTIISPAPIGGSEAITPVQDDLRIYRIPRIDPVMALDRNGQRIYLSFKE